MEKEKNNEVKPEDNAAQSKEQNNAAQNSEQQKGDLQGAVENRIEEILDNMPEEEPITKADVSQMLDDRLTKLEESLAARFVQMGGVINDGGKPVEQKEKVNTYTPLTQLDYKM